jgi:hypothetical protein
LAGSGDVPAEVGGRAEAPGSAGSRRETMRAFVRWALVLIVPVVWVATARPADEILPEGATVPLLLLRQKSVQEELKLTPEVVKKIMDFTNKESDEYREGLKLKDAEKEKKIEALEKANQKFLEDNLSADQRKRLNQITLQVTGLHQLNRPDVAKALDLTAEQQATFKRMHDEAKKQYEDIFQAKTREDKNEKLAKLREAMDKKIESVLTDEQKKKARAAVGEQFKGKLVIEEPKEEPADKK